MIRKSGFSISFVKLASLLCYNMKERLHHYLPGITLFFLSVLLALFVYKDFGISFDEQIQREMGEVSYNYITKGDHKLDTYSERDHGTGFELVLIFIERNFHINDSRDIYLMRHLVSHLFFLVSCFFGYVLCYRLFRDKLIASIGFLLFVFHPRIYAHSFFNTKDLPFLSAFLISLAICHWAFDKDKPYLYLLAGVVCGYAASIRILGVMLACIVIFLLLIDIAREVYKKGLIKRKVIALALFAAGFSLMLYAAFPTLWRKPFASFAEVYSSLAHFRWENNMLFDGKIENAAHLPWTYLPVWFSNTTPVILLAFALIGIVILIANIFRKPLAFLFNTPERHFAFYLACFLSPVLYIIIMRSVVYDDWRHVYFIYPSFVLLVMYAVHKLYSRKFRVVSISLIGVQFILLGSFMVKSHPFQHIYFNELVPHKPEFLRYNYEMDYWGLSYRQALEYVLEHDKRPTIKVGAPHNLCLVVNNILILPKEQRQRLSIAYDVNDAEYIFTNFRDHPGDYDYPVIFYDIKVLNSTIQRVYSAN
jgi:hypothetical protein